MKNTKAPAILGIIIGIMAVSTASLFIRYAQGYASSMVIAAYRLLIAALILAPYVFIKYRFQITSLSSRSWKITLLSGMFLAIHFATWITSLEYTSVISSVTLVSTTPLWIALLAPRTTKEKITRYTLVGLCVAMIGSLIISIGDSCFFIDNRIECDFLSVEKNTIFGNFLAVLGAVSASGYLLAGRKLRHTIALPVYLLLSYGVGAAILILVNIIIRNPFFTYPPITYLLFLLLALLPQLIGHSSLNWALGYLPTVVVSISLLGEPVGSTILAYLFLGEVPQPAKLIGAILILIGIATSFVEPRPTISRDKKKCSFNDPY